MSWYFDKLELYAAGCTPIPTIGEATKIGYRPDLDDQDGQDILSKLGSSPVHPIFSRENFSASSYRYFRVENLYRQYDQKAKQGIRKPRDEHGFELLPKNRSQLPIELEDLPKALMKFCPAGDLDFGLAPEGSRKIRKRSQESDLGERRGLSAKNRKPSGVRKPLPLNVYSRMKPALQLASLMIENSYPWFFRVIQAGEKKNHPIDPEKTMKEIWTLSHIDPNSPVSPRHFQPGVPNALQQIVDTTFFFFSDSKHDGGGVNHPGLDMRGSFACTCPVVWDKVLNEEEDEERKSKKTWAPIKKTPNHGAKMKFAIEVEGEWLQQMSRDEWGDEGDEIEEWKDDHSPKDGDTRRKIRLTASSKRATLFHLAVTLTHEVCHRMYMALSAILNSGAIWTEEPFWKAGEWENEAGFSWENWFFGGLPNQLSESALYCGAGWTAWENADFEQDRWLWGDGAENHAEVRPEVKGSQKIGGGPSNYALTTRCIRNFFELDRWHEQFGRRTIHPPRSSSTLLQKGSFSPTKPPGSGKFIDEVGWEGPGLWLEIAPFRTYHSEMMTELALEDYDICIEVFYLQHAGEGSRWVHQEGEQTNIPELPERNPLRLLLASPLSSHSKKRQQA